MKRMIEMRALLVAATSVALLAGCTVGPNYKPPEFIAPTNYGAAPTTQPAQSVAWWTLFNDPTLDQLITMAHRANLDLKASEARVREARAQRGATASDWYPSVDGFG